MDNQSIILKIQEMQMQIKALESNSQSGGLLPSDTNKLRKDIEALRVIVLDENRNNQITKKEVNDLIDEKVTQLYISNLYRTK